jgi:16S rRNA processing protein RimM
VGRVARPHGLDGEVGVVLLGDDPARLAAGRELRLERAGEPPRTVRVASSRRGTRGPLVRLEGVSTRDAAEALRGAELSVAFDPANLGAGEFYAHQLEGLRVVAPDGAELGRVTGVAFGPGRPLLEVTVPGRAPQLVPFHPDLVRGVDLEQGLLTLEAPEGLLEL